MVSHYDYFHIRKLYLWMDKKKLSEWKWKWGVPWIRQTFAGLWLWRPEFDAKPFHVRFLVDQVAPGQVCSSISVFLVSNILPVLHAHLFTHYWSHWQHPNVTHSKQEWYLNLFVITKFEKPPFVFSKQKLNYWLHTCDNLKKIKIFKMSARMWTVLIWLRL